MNNLHDLQAAFKRYLFEEDNKIVSHVISTEKLTSNSRLAIYGNAYRSRLIDALANDYSALKYLLGEDDFSHLSLAYIKAYPSTHYSLRWFGQDLARFLDNHRIYRKHHYLTELAKFEWAFVNAFDAKDAKVSGIEDATKIPPDSWPGLRMVLHPSVRWVTCSWNCLSIWQSMKNKTAAPAPQPLDMEVNYLIWRQDLNTIYRSLDSDEADALSAVAKGADFTELCIALTKRLKTEETSLRAASLFKTWLAEGLISRIIFFPG